MNPDRTHPLIFSVMCLTLILAMAACTSVPAVTPADRIQQLQAYVDDLSQQLKAANSADATAQQSLMRGYWGSLQRQLRNITDMPGVQARGCADWIVLDPAVTGNSGFYRNRSCPAMHDGGPMLGLPFPDQMAPRLFLLVMTQQLAELRGQVEDIAAAQDTAAREELIREHYETRYRDLQTVIGRDWMWTPREAVTLPESSSTGARLFQGYCSQCHAAPPPSLKTPAEWGYLTRRMAAIIQSQSAVAGSGIRMPSADELQAISQYLEDHGTH